MCARLACSIGAVLALTALGLSAQSRPPITATDPQFDQAAVARGSALFVGQCGFCHGSNARGGIVRSRPHTVGARAGRRGRKAARGVSPHRPAGQGHAGVSARTRSGRRHRHVPSRGHLSERQPPPVPGARYPGRRSEGRRGVFLRRRQVRDVPLADRRFERRRREVRRGHAAGPDADAARRPRRRTAAAGLSRQERDQGDDHAAVAPDRLGRARAADGLRRHALRSADGTDPVVAAQRRRAEDRGRRPAAGPHRHCTAGPTPTCTT